MVWHPVPVTSLRSCVPGSCRPTRFRRAAPVTVALVAVAMGGLAGCSGSGSGTGAGTAASGSGTQSPAALLSHAKSVLDSASAVHFVVSSTDVPQGVTVLAGGEGDAARPDKFAGDLDVSLSGTRAKVAVVSVGGTVYVKLPFATTYSVTDPKKFNIPDPGSFMSATSGVTQVLAQATDAKDSGQTRLGDAVLRTVVAHVPGQVVDAVLRTADPSTPVTATFGIEPASGQLRTATLVGPFFTKGVNSTYTLVLSRYGESTDIRVPTG